MEYALRWWHFRPKRYIHRYGHTETLDRSNLGDLKVGSLVNLERSVQLQGRLDGHIVQGHVDCTGTCTHLERYKAVPTTIEYKYPAT